MGFSRGESAAEASSRKLLFSRRSSFLPSLAAALVASHAGLRALQLERDRLALDVQERTRPAARVPGTGGAAPVRAGSAAQKHVPSVRRFARRSEPGASYNTTWHRHRIRANALLVFELSAPSSSAPRRV